MTDIGADPFGFPVCWVITARRAEIAVRTGVSVEEEPDVEGILIGLVCGGGKTMGPCAKKLGESPAVVPFPFPDIVITPAAAAASRYVLSLPV